MNKTTLVFAPHPDDDVLGVGGTIIKKIRNGENVVICIATEGKDKEVRHKETLQSCKAMGVSDICHLRLPDLKLDKIPHEVINQKVLEVIHKYNPYEVYTPHPGDLHTDHKSLTAAIMVAIRPKYDHIPLFAYTYETLSETGWDYQNPINSFSPNVYENISDTIQDKINALKKHESQIDEFPSSRSLEAVEALAVYRGTQAGFKAAEAFSLIRGYRL